MSDIVDLMKQGAGATDLFTDPVGPRSSAVDPNQNIKAYRGENLLKSYSAPLNTPESAGKWYGFSADKASRYPDNIDTGNMLDRSQRVRKAPGILGGAVTRSMDVSPDEIIEASRKAMYQHANVAFDRNIKNGVERPKAENIFFKDLNDIDDFHASSKNQLDKGTLSKDRFDFMLKSTMQEGVFDKKGSIDIGETFKRGNVGVAALTGAARALPKAAFGLAGLPIDAVLGATETGLDAQEEVGQAMGIDPSVFYQMDPEKFENIYNNYKTTVANMQQQRTEDAKKASGEMRSAVPLDAM